MLAAEEYLCGGGAASAGPPPERRWLRLLLQWSGVVLAHAALLGIVLQVSPRARQVLGEVVQASLVVPQRPVVPPEPLPASPKPPKPVPKRLPPPAPLLSAARSAEAPPSSFIVPEPPAEPAPAAEPMPAVAAAPAATPVAPPLPLVLPAFNADYLDNPAPQYPPMSRRRGETGRVLLRVFVSADGLAERVEIKTSSGFERLDAAAREAVVRWRFVPARRGDEKVAAWVLVPITFVM